MRIAIFGTVGAGKTTLIKELQALLPNDYIVIKEPLVDNPYFEGSYSPDPEIAKANAYKMEIMMLAMRMKQLHESKGLQNVLFDRGIFDNPVFAQTNFESDYLNAIDWKVYSDYFDKVILPSIAESKPYDHVIYLRVDDNTSLERIKERGINRELNVKPDFWKRLNGLYDVWANKIGKHIPLLTIDGNQEDPQSLAKQILAKVA